MTPSCCGSWPPSRPSRGAPQYKRQESQLPPNRCRAIEIGALPRSRPAKRRHPLATAPCTSMLDRNSSELRVQCDRAHRQCRCWSSQRDIEPCEQLRGHRNPPDCGYTGRRLPAYRGPKPRLRHLNETLFASLGHACAVLGAWKEDYNTVRPHSSLGGKTLSEIARIRKRRPSNSASDTKSKDPGHAATPLTPQANHRG